MAGAIGLETGAFGLGGAGSLARHSDLVSRQESFAEALSIADRRIGAVSKDPESEARAAAEQLVAIAFVQPVLALMRESDGAAEPFAPTQAEKQFGGLQDARLAHDLVKASRFPLVERLAQDLLRNNRGAVPARVDAQGDGLAQRRTER